MLENPIEARKVELDSRPAFAGVDPYNKLVDRDSDDNLGPIVNS